MSDKVMTYTLSVTITRPIFIHDHAYTLEEIADWMAGNEAKTELEKEVLQALKRIDGDCDCEVIDHAITEEP